MTARATEAIADPYSGRSISARTRARRWTELLRRFPDLPDMRVVDLGGDSRHWVSCPSPPREITFVNLYEQPWAAEHRVVVADACEVPCALAGERFDLAYCNSVIEHVGGHEQRRRLASTIGALADHRWVQTPYRYFPVEPHWLCPALQWLPVRARVALTRRWRLGHRRAQGSEAVENVLTVELLTCTEMRHYFPDSDLWVERFMGLPKSLIAVG
jgi:hypothetical protein